MWEDVAGFSVNRYSRIGLSEVKKSIQNIEVSLKESGLEIAPMKYQLCIFDKKKIRNSQWRVGNHGTGKKGFFRSKKSNF
jgi:hypothetical protein